MRWLLPAALTAISATAVADTRPVLIDNVTLIDGSGAPPRPGTTLVIAGNRFTAVATANEAQLPKDAERIDGTGKFGIPGLWDMHVHLTQMTEIAGPALIANGVTGVRDMGGSLELVDWMQERFAQRITVGPRVFRAGPFVDGSKPGVSDRLVVSNAGDGRNAVEFLQRRGVDFIKVHNGCPPDAFFALLQEAQRRRIRTAGHIPLDIDPAAAITAGYNSIEHVVSLFEGPVSKKVKAGRSQPDAMAEFTDAEAHRLGALMREKNAWFDPTLIYYWSIAHAAELKAHPDERDRYVSKSAHEFWKIFPERPDTPEVRRRLDEAFARFVQIVSIVREEKVKFLIGTDLGGKNIFPGFSVHDELRLLVEKVGVAPMDVLVAATRHSAEALGQDKDLGTIAPGKIADVVLLAGDPLADIANTRKIEVVIVDGRVFRKPQLDEMLVAVAKDAPNR